MSRFREIIRNKNFSLLWMSQVASQFGDRIIQMALIALVYSVAPGSTFQLAKVISFTIIPVFVIGPVAGVYVDRWDRRKTMVISDGLKSILMLSVPLMFISRASMVSIYVVIFLVFCIGRFYVPAKLSIIPDLVPGKQLLIANSLANMTGMVAAAFGFGLGGILVDAWGAKGGFYLASVSFFVAATTIIFIGTKIVGHIKKEEILELGKEVIEVIKKSVIAEIKDGVAYLIKQKEISFIIKVLFLLWSALGSIYVVAVIFIQHALGTVTKDLGLLIMFLGVGLFIGSLVYGRLGHRVSHFKVIFSCLAFSGVVLSFFVVALTAYPNFIVAATIAFIFGMIVSPIMAAANTLVHEAASSQMRGKVFSSLEIVMHFAFLLFMLISSKLADLVGEFWFLIYTGLIITIVGLFGYIRYGVMEISVNNDKA
ncbi:MAG: MFS transporter [Candidatus Omnitrophica bacterium]|nr:MFS transporter [Candidatus Omnitrophota bacterium]